MTSWKIFNVVERGEGNIPLSELMTDGHLDLYEDAQSSGFFNFSLQKDRLVLVAGNCIGLIPLNSRVALHVEPKVARENWLRIVGKARADLRALDHLVNYSRTDFVSRSILEFLARALLSQLTPVEDQGVYCLYQPKTQVTPFPRGRILFRESINLSWGHGHSRSVAVKYYSFSRDTPHNRLLKYALSLSIGYLERLPETTRDLRRQMVVMENLFASIALDSTLRYLPQVLASLERGSIPHARSYYEDVCRTAILIVERTALQPRSGGEETTLSFVVNMETTFQSYCFEILRASQRILGDGVDVCQAPDGNEPLFVGPSSDTRKAEPDIVLTDATGHRLPIEVKYKDTPNRQDINQAIAYGLAYQSGKVVLVCYAPAIAQSGWRYLGKVGQEIDVWIYRINLNSTNLDEEETRFVQEMKRMLSGDVRP